MIKSWSVNNIKSVYGKTALSLAPLTIFAGANNAGKSTFIQSMLLIAQTLQSPLENQSLILNGNIIKTGTYKDIISNGASAKDISIGFELVPLGIKARDSFSIDNKANVSGRSSIISCQIEYASKNKLNSKEDQPINPYLKSCNMTILMTGVDGQTQENIRIIRDKKAAAQKLSELSLNADFLQTNDMESLNFCMPKKSANIFGVDFSVGRIAGVQMNHFLPQQIATVVNEADLNAQKTTEAIVYPYSFKHAMNRITEGRIIISNELLEIIIRILKEVMDELNENQRQRIFNLTGDIECLKRSFNIQNYFKMISLLSPNYKQILFQKLEKSKKDIFDAVREHLTDHFVIKYIALPDSFTTSTKYIRTFFRDNFKYLGPLRDAPKPVYPLSDETYTSDIGLKGEHTATVLDTYKNITINYIPASYFAGNSVNVEAQMTPLINAASDWLTYMGMANIVKTIDKGKLGHEVKVSTGNESTFHDLTHVGVGISQLLPIIVLALMAEQGSTIVFEQPELHLHPRVQTRLADFFISMLMLNKQCIVETHSEHIINQLRYRSVTTDNSRVSDGTVIYFVEKQGEQSVFNKLTIDSFGRIDNWPKGFFDENSNKAAEILMAGIQKRKKIMDKE